MGRPSSTLAAMGQSVLAPFRCRSAAWRVSAPFEAAHGRKGRGRGPFERTFRSRPEASPMDLMTSPCALYISKRLDPSSS